MKQVELAKKLDLTPKQVYNLVKRGMPTRSLKAALFWRSTSLDVSQTKALRMCGNNGRNGRKNQKPKIETKTASKQMAASKNETMPSSDSNDIFLYQILEDSTVLICAALIGEMGMSYRKASLTFNTICDCIAEIYSEHDYNCPVYDVPCPTDTAMPVNWRNQIKTKINQKARELELLGNEPV